MNAEEIAQQVQLLAAHRRTLTHYLKQQATMGEAHIPPSVTHGIYESRAQITRIKDHLRNQGADIDDWLDDNNESIDQIRSKNSIYSEHSLNLLIIDVDGVSKLESVEKQRKVIQPPANTEYLLWYLPRKIRAAVIGDLEEEFRIIYNRYGQRKADTWYYYQTAASFWPFAMLGIKKLIRLGILGWVEALLHRFIS